VYKKNFQVLFGEFL